MVLVMAESDIPLMSAWLMMVESSVTLHSLVESTSAAPLAMLVRVVPFFSVAVMELISCQRDRSG
jgi:hypothetical protein